MRRNTWRPRATRPVNVEKKRDALLNKGWKIGLLCAAAILNDEFDFTNQQIHDFMVDCDALMYSMAKSVDDWDKISRQMEKMSGIQLNVREGEKPLDGRFAIVDEAEPEADEWEEEDDG